MADDARPLLLRDRHAAAGARFVPFAGWEMPIWYGGSLEEHVAVRTTAGCFDLSHMGRLHVLGPDAAAALDGAVTIDVPAVPLGAARYALFCDADGRILDDLMIYKLADDEVLVVCNAASRATVVPALTERLDGRAELDDRTETVQLIAVQGPDAADLLAARGAEVEGLKRFRVAPTELLGRPVLLARTGYTGEDGFEVFVPNDDAGALWDDLVGSGAVGPAGLAARDSLRLEAGLTLYGSDMTTETSPYELGLGKFVHLQTSFVGRDALAALAEQPPTRELRGLKLEGRRVARGHEDVTADGRRIGEVTSGVFSPTLDAPIAFALVEPGLAEGATVGVALRGAEVAAEVVPVPFLTRPGTRKGT